MIYTVHGQQVILDSDLAELYGVLTGNLNKAASRNAERFPEDFRFRVSKEEYESLMFQTGISNDGGRGGRRKLPYVYTKQGVSMLSAVLKSEVAVRVSVQIIRAFVEMRHLIADNAAMSERIRDVRRTQIEYQEATNKRLDNIGQNLERVFDYNYMDSHEEPTQKVFFDGQV